MLIYAYFTLWNNKMSFDARVEWVTSHISGSVLCLHSNTFEKLMMAVCAVHLLTHPVATFSGKRVNAVFQISVWIGGVAHPVRRFWCKPPQNFETLFIPICMYQAAGSRMVTVIQRRVWRLSIFTKFSPGMASSSKGSVNWHRNLKVNLFSKSGNSVRGLKKSPSNYLTETASNVFKFN